MVVSAHPDDPDFGAGGSIARLADSGAEVTYVIVTDGQQGGEDPTQKDSELVAIRKKDKQQVLIECDATGEISIHQSDIINSPRIKL